MHVLGKIMKIFMIIGVSAMMLSVVFFYNARKKCKKCKNNSMDSFRTILKICNDNIHKFER